MKIKGKILSLLGILSISFSAFSIGMGAFCPDVVELNKDPNLLLDGSTVNVPNIGPMRVELKDEEFPIQRYISFNEVIIFENALRCVYRAFSELNPFTSTPKVFLNRKGQWKPVNSEAWNNGINCTTDIRTCAVTNQ